MSTPEVELSAAWQQHVSADVELLDRLLARHREKQRRYHTATHVAWVIRHIDELHAVTPAHHLDEIVAAAFYHDAIYEPTHPANERASARLARRDLATLGWSDAATERVGAMIEATAHLSDAALPSPDHDTAILLDADLAVLGSEPAAYDAYVTGIRAEYRHLDDREWANGRAQVLQRLLDREAIYCTAPGVQRWEERARGNLTAELAGLG